jgi:putative MFS transporter
MAPAFIFFGACFVVGAVVYLFAQETKGKSLDQI